MDEGMAVPDVAVTMADGTIQSLATLARPLVV